MGKRTVAEVLWALKQADGQVISCKLIAQDADKFELALFAGEERVIARRYLSSGSAELEAESMKERVRASVKGMLMNMCDFAARR